MSRSETAKENYSGSALEARNYKISLGMTIGAVKKGDQYTARFDGLERVMTAMEYVEDIPEVLNQINLGREAYLLISDMYNYGGFSPLSIYDIHIEQEENYCQFELHCGSVLVHPDTLIYWK
jgi:hypothetical protein